MGISEMLKSCLAGLICLFSLAVCGSHIMGGNITYEPIGSGNYQVTLTYYADCFGLGAPPSEQNLFFFPHELSCAFPFSAPLDFIDEVDITDLCPSEMPNSSCNGGWLPGVVKITYSGAILLDPACNWDVSWQTDGWHNFVNMDNSAIPTAYIGTTLYPSFGDFNSVNVVSSGAPYWCIGDQANHYLMLDNPDALTLSFSLTDVLTTGGVPAPWADGYDGGNPIPGVTIDSESGTISFATPSIFGNYVVGVLIEMYDGDGNLVGSVLENMVFVIRLCGSGCPGCTDSLACNYSSAADEDDGSCDYSCFGCTDNSACNFSESAYVDDDSCDFSCLGCTDLQACNFDPSASQDDGSCDFSCIGCSDESACNYSATVTIDDGSCYFNCDSCEADLNGDGLVNTPDLLILLTVFGCLLPDDCTAVDFNNDLQTNVSDLLFFLSTFNSICDE
jgi:hypothetical protein